MSDPNDPNAPDPENPEYPEQPQTGAVYPVNDGQGGTAFVIGNTDEQATFEQWAAQNGVGTATDEAVEYDDDGNPLTRDADDDEPDEIEFGTTKGTEAEKVSAVAAAVDDAT
jgi:poly(3-hydroxybutyrate) depolymerase